MPNSPLDADPKWRPLDRLTVPPLIRDWLGDPGSLTARLRLHGTFHVRHNRSLVTVPVPFEREQLHQSGRRIALIREVTLMLCDTPVVEARSVLPLLSLRWANRNLAHMGGRSLGSELYRYPEAHRDQVWVRYGLSPAGRGPCWGRQTRFVKRGRPLLVAEYFLPALWSLVGEQ